MESLIAALYGALPFRRAVLASAHHHYAPDNCAVCLLRECFAELDVRARRAFCVGLSAFEWRASDRAARRRESRRASGAALRRALWARATLRSAGKRYQRQRQRQRQR